jgi:hypothetical protein
MNRYAATLLFQFKVIVGGVPGKRRTCEERIIVIEANSARAALRHAKTRDNDSQHRYRNTDGNPVRFEFVGVMDRLELGVECAADEVWYEITDRLEPSERRAQLIPLEQHLNALLLASQRLGQSGNLNMRAKKARKAK